MTQIPDLSVLSVLAPILALWALAGMFGRALLYAPLTGVLGVRPGRVTPGVAVRLTVAGPVLLLCAVLIHAVLVRLSAVDRYFFLRWLTTVRAALV